MADGGASTRPVVLVTGASGGIGAALAREFAAHGHDLVLVARRREALETLAGALRQAHGVEAHVLALALDLPEAGDTVEAELARLGLHVDVLVNAAGFGLSGRASRLDRAEQLEMIDVNIRALADLTLRFLPGMVERRSGGVLNVGSIAGFQPGPFMAGYYATKAFVHSWTSALATECRKSGVRITNLAPGPVDTGFSARARLTKSKMFALSPVLTAEATAKAGHAAFMAGRRLVVPGFVNRVGVGLGRIVPGRLRDKAITLLIRSR
jgi:hypothetical protein